MGVVCVVLLTSSQNHPPEVAPGQMAMVCLQETAFWSASIDDHGNDHRQDTAACVSLSKSTMSKTRTTCVEPTDYARRRRGAGCLSAPNLTVNRLTQHPKYARMRAQKSPRGRRGMPHQSVAIRLKARRIGQSARKIKNFSHPDQTRAPVARSAQRRWPLQLSAGGPNGRAYADNGSS